MESAFSLPGMPTVSSLPNVAPSAAALVPGLGQSGLHLSHGHHPTSSMIFSNGGVSHSLNLSSPTGAVTAHETSPGLGHSATLFSTGVSPSPPAAVPVPLENAVQSATAVTSE